MLLELCILPPKLTDQLDCMDYPRFHVQLLQLRFHQILELIYQLQQLLAAAREEGRQQLQTERDQSCTWREQAEQALAESLRVQQAALLAEFKRETQAIAEESRMSFQGVMRETLESIDEILGAKPRLPRKEPEPGAKES